MGRSVCAIALSLMFRLLAIQEHFDAFSSSECDQVGFALAIVRMSRCNWPESAAGRRGIASARAAASPGDASG